MGPLRRLTTQVVHLAADDVDTDQIIPARFLKGTTREGLGAHLFADWRRGQPDFVLDRPEAAGAQMLLAGRNFGCGSSREHAVWALRGHGFRAVAARSFADIFRANALKNGLLPIDVDERTHALLAQARGAEVTVDVETGTLTLPGRAVAAFDLAPFARYCLLHGLDELEFLLSQAPHIEAYERSLGRG
jgi:3-isopropylmalate/(R)-2-methylmalate dehydratase small subunit